MSKAAKFFASDGLIVLAAPIVRYGEEILLLTTVKEKRVIRTYNFLSLRQDQPKIGWFWYFFDALCQISHQIGDDFKILSYDSHGRRENRIYFGSDRMSMLYSLQCADNPEKIQTNYDAFGEIMPEAFQPAINLTTLSIEFSLRLSHLDESSIYLSFTVPQFLEFKGGLATMVLEKISPVILEQFPAIERENKKLMEEKTST